MKDMTNSKSLLIVVILILVPITGCGPSEGDTTESTSNKPETQEKSEYVLPRSLDSFTLGESFVIPENFEEPEAAAKYMFNEIEGKTFASKGFFGAHEKGESAVLVNTINNKIVSIKRIIVLEREEAVEEVLQFKQKYENIMQAGRSFESDGRDFEWYRFDDEYTWSRLERDRDKLTIEISAWDLDLD